MSDSLKQSFVVENRPGAGSIIGTDAVAKSPPDGYTLLLMSNTHTTNESLTPNKPFQLMRDFVPVAPINYSDLVMVVHPSVPAKISRSSSRWRRKSPASSTMALPDPATPYHMAGELFKAMSGTDIVHIPHKASGEMRSAVIGGHVQMAFDAVTTMTREREGRAGPRAGDLRRQAFLRSARCADGRGSGVPGYEVTIWLGLMAPAGTPKADRRQAQRRDQQGDRQARG